MLTRKLERAYEQFRRGQLISDKQLLRRAKLIFAEEQPSTSTATTQTQTNKKNITSTSSSDSEIETRNETIEVEIHTPPTRL